MPNREKIELLVSFLNETDAVAIQNITTELTSLNYEGNNILKELLHTLNSTEATKRLKRIIEVNNLRIIESDILKAAHNNKLSLLDWLCFINKLEYPDLDTAAIKTHVGKMAKDIWLRFESNDNPIDAAENLTHFFTKEGRFKIIPIEEANVKHFLLNDVLTTGEVALLFLNILYVCIAQLTGLPIVPLRLADNLFVAFENKGDYNISIISNRYLFFIDTVSFEPFAESTVPAEFRDKGSGKLVLEPHTNSTLASILIEWMATCAEKNQQAKKVTFLRALAEKL